MKERVTYRTVFPAEALADPVRRAIVERLADGEVGAGEIAADFPVSRPAISRHLRVLREAGLVRARPEAQRRVYEVDPAPLVALDAWLAPYRRLWSDSLDALGRRLEETDPRKDTP